MTSGTRSSRVGVGIPGTPRHVGVPPFSFVLGTTLPVTVGDTLTETSIVAGSRRVSTIPEPSSGIGLAFGLPPFPPPRFMIPGDVVFVVQQAVVIRPIARAAAPNDLTVTASAAIRADGGKFALAPSLSAAVTAAATVRARFTRTASATAGITAAAAVIARWLVPTSAGVTASAAVSAVASTTAPDDMTVTASAALVAVGGNVPVAPALSTTVTAASAVVQRMPAALAASATVTASAARVQRMAVSAAASGVVTASAVVRVNLRTVELAGATVTASAIALPGTVDMGLSKTATQTHVSSASLWRKQTGWSIRAGFPDTQLVNDTLVVKGSGNYRCVFLDARLDSHSSSRARILVNGVEVAQATPGLQNLLVDVTGALNDGDVLQFESFVNTVGTNARISGTSTYVELTRA